MAAAVLRLGARERFALTTLLPWVPFDIPAPTTSSKKTKGSPTMTTLTAAPDPHSVHLKSSIVSVSLLEALKFYCLAIVCGLTALLKLGTLWMWNSKKYFVVKKRDRPPRCLVDSVLGQHSYIKLKDAKLHYVESGCSDNPLLILLHGFLDCWIGWRYQIPALEPHFRVIAVDLKGFGDSEKPTHRKKYSVKKLVQELADFITAVGGGASCVLVGHDIGALLGWFLLYEHPELVSRFVAISCPHPNVFWNELPKKSQFNARFVHECQLPWLSETKMMQGDLAVLDEYLKHLPATSSARGIVSRETYKYVFSRKVDWTGALNYYRGLWWGRVQPNVGPSRAPVLLMVGDADGYCSMEASVRSTEQEERLLVRVISDAGHFPHQQAPMSVNRHLMNFLAVPEGRIGCTSSSPQMPHKGLVNRMFGALSSTVQYGNQVLESVTKRGPNDTSDHQAILLGVPKNGPYNPQVVM